MWHILIVIGLEPNEIGVVRVVDANSFCLLPNYFSNQNPKFRDIYILLLPEYLERDRLYVDYYDCGDVIIPKLRVMWEEQPRDNRIIQTAIITRPLNTDVGIYHIPAPAVSIHGL